MTGTEHMPGLKEIEARPTIL